MNLDAWHALSLRRTLLLVLFPGLLLVVGAELWSTWRTAVDAANAAYDRSLLGAIKAMDANISTASGGLGVELPYRMLEFFELTASGRVFYRVATEDGLVEIGNADLPPPPRPLVTGQPQFSDASYFDEPVRVGSYARMLDRPLAGQPRAAAHRDPGRRDAAVAAGIHPHAGVAVARRATWRWWSRPPACWCSRSAGRCGHWRGCAPRCRRDRHRT